MTNQNTNSALRVVCTGATTALGRETIRQLARAGHTALGLVRSDQAAALVAQDGGQAIHADPLNGEALAAVYREYAPDVLLNIAPQLPNNLLHDGHDWRGFVEFLPKSTTALIEAARAAPGAFLVHLSYAFLYGDAPDATESDPLVVPGNAPTFQVAVQAEKVIQQSGVPACVLRLGYLYGPQIEDMAEYAEALRHRQAYYAGPERGLANWLHIEDAARALILVAARRPAGTVYNITDGQPVGMRTFIEEFARQIGARHPRRTPLWAALLLRSKIRPEQVTLLALAATVRSAAFRSAFNWKPRYADYLAGLEQTARVLAEVSPATSLRNLGHPGR